MENIVIRSEPKPIPERKEINVEPRELKSVDEIDVVLKNLFYGYSVHVEIFLKDDDIKIASFPMVVDNVRIDSTVISVENLFRNKLIQDEQEEYEDRCVPCGLTIEGGEIKGTEVFEREYDENNNLISEGIVPDVVMALFTTFSSDANARVGKNYRGDLYMEVIDDYNNLKYYIKRLSSRKRKVRGKA